MSANGSAMTDAPSETLDKGKGKQVDQPGHTMNVEEDEEDSDESGPEEQPEEEEDEDMEEIDPSNIISSKTRNKQIDWAEAEQKSKDAGDEFDDDDDDEDDDFEGEVEDEDEEMKG